MRPTRPMACAALAAVVIGTLAVRPVSGQQRVVVATNDPGAHVYADSTWLGLASSQVFALPADAAFVRVVPADIGSWDTPAVRVAVTSEDTIRVDARFPYTYRLESTPFAASVFAVRGDEREALGQTPVVYRAEQPGEGTFRFEREGFEPVTLVPGGELWNRHVAVLKPMSSEAAIATNLRLDVGAKQRRWIEVAAIGVAAVGGALAVHYKTKADNRFDVYSETGDPALRPGIKRLDTRSAVALGAMQAGVGVLAIRLVLR